MKTNFGLRRLLLIAVGFFAGGMCMAFDHGDRDDAGSSASVLDIDPTFVFATRLPYFVNQSSNFQTDPAFVTIARFKLTDGDGVTPDVDGNATSVQSLALSLTHPTYIRRIALYDQLNNVIPGTEQDVNGASSIVFNSLQSYISALDNGATTFTVRVSFTAAVTDRDVIRINVAAVTADPSGSLFNSTPSSLIGGVVGGAITPSNKNLVDVIANHLVFATQPGAVEGINQPVTQPSLHAVDQNDILDFDASGPSITSAVGMSGVPTTFNNGVLDFAAFQYTSPGNGTLTASIAFPASVPSVISTRVDVIHVVATAATGGVLPTSTLSSGSTANDIFGVTFDVPYSVPGSPVLNEFTVNFGNPITGVFNNFRIYASLDATLNKLVDQDITSLTATTVAGSQLRVIFNTGNGWGDFLRSRPGFPVLFDLATNSTHVSFFIEADVNVNANFAVPAMTPSLVRLSYTGASASNIQLVSGSSFANITGNTYTFQDVTKPIISSSAPFIGQLNQAVDGDIVITFSEPVKAIDGKITIFETDLNKFVAELTTINPLNTFRTSFTFKTTYIDPVTSLLTNYLKPDTRYYITITPVDANSTQGYIDSSNNGFDGIADYSRNFKTSSVLPPVVTNAAQFNNISLRGGTFSIGLDQGGDVFYMIVANPSAPPGSIAEIAGTATYSGASVITRGSIKIEQPNTYQYIVVPAAFGNNAKYDIYMYAQNDAVVPVPTGILPSLTFVAKDPVGAGIILESPTVNICPGGFIKVFSPISIVERNIDDFQNKDGEMVLALPSGFVFNTDVTPVLKTIGPDFVVPTAPNFIDPDTIEFINNTLLRVTFQNRTSTGFDRLTISGLQIKATTATGTGKIIKLAGTAFPSITAATALTTLTIRPKNSVDFGNSESNVRFFSDDSKNILLIPNPSDFGPNVFSGPGVVAGSDSLYIKLAGIGAHDIVLTHTYEEGCVVNQTNVYTIFEHNNAIAGIDKSQYCTTDGIAIIRYDGRAGSANAPYYLKSLSVDLPDAALADTVQLLGKYYRSLVKSSLRKTDSIVVGGIMYRSYQFDPGVFNSQQLRKLFKTTDGGGLLGQIVFKSVYVSGLTFKESSLPLKININMPPDPVITRDALGLNLNYPTQYCEELGKLKFTGLPSPVAGQRTASFQLLRYNGATGVYVPVAAVGVLTDLNDGTAIFDTKASVAGFGYDSLRLDYMVHSLTSQCDAITSLKFRITPNPAANFALKGAACEGVKLQFQNLSSIAASSSGFRIDEWSWDFDDPNNFTPTNPNKLVGNNPASTDPIHYYTVATATGYNPKLVVKSNYGCVSPVKTTNFIVGGVPKISLSFTGVSAPITLQNTATVFETNGIDSIQYLFRKKLFTPVKTKGDTTFKVFPMGAPFSPSPGTYDLRLRVKSKLGCVATITKPLVVLSMKVVTDSNPYLEKFEKLDSGGWQIQPDTLRASWRVGLPGIEKKIIKSNPALNGKAFWFTGRKGPYNSRERSYLYAGVYDISQLDRPLITFNSFVQMEQSDGVVLQYSIDNKNVTDSTKVWTTLGSYEAGVSSGEGWYNAQGLASKPGNQQTKDYGWTGNSATSWGISSHLLDEIIGAKRVAFRFALGSVKASPQLDGFGLDNIRIGNRTRTILLESFSNTGNKTLFNGTFAEKNESDAIRSFQDTKTGVDIIKLNYHVSFPDNDPFNIDAPAPPSSRALFYSIVSAPASVMDGRGSPDPSLKYFSQWGPGEFGRRILKLGQANISILPLPGSTSLVDKGMVGLIVRVTAIETLPVGTVLQVAVVEQSVKLPPAKQALVKTGETEFNFVVKRLLPSASGTKFNTALPEQTSIDLGPFTWIPDFSKMYNNPGKGDLSVVVFLQNEDTREVYQSKMINNLDDPDPNIITAIENIADEIKMYPNPSDDAVTILLSQPADKEVPVSIINTVGMTIASHSILKGARQLTINTSALALGVYIVHVGDETSMVRQRLVIVH